MTPSGLRRLPWAQILLLALLVLVVAACATAAPGASGSPAPSPSPHPPLTPAQPGADPLSFLAWLFNPIFQAMLIILIGVYSFLEGLGVPAAIGWAIVVLTLVVRTVVIPLYRRQLTSQRRTQLLQPEVKAIQKRYKGDAMKARAAQQELFKERGVNPLSGCLPLLLQMPLLFIMYSVIQNGLTNVDPTAMLTVFGHQIIPLTCNNLNAAGVPDASLGPCIDTVIPFLGGIDVSKPSTFISIGVGGFVLGLSFLAIASAGLQLVQSRMMLPISDPANDDPNTKIQRQTMLLLPLLSPRLRRAPAGGAVHLLDHSHDLLDRAAVPHRGLGRDVPVLRVDPRVRHRPHAEIPGGDATTTRARQARGHPDRRGEEDDGREDDPPPRAGPSGPTRETTLT